MHKAISHDDLELIAEFVDETRNALDHINNQLVKLLANPGDFTLLNEIHRAIFAIKSNAAFLGLMKTRTLTHQIETLLDDIRKQRLPSPTAGVIAAVLNALDEIKLMLERVLRREQEAPDQAAFNELLESIKTLHPHAAQPATATPEHSPTERRPRAQQDNPYINISLERLAELQQFTLELSRLQQKLIAQASDPARILQEAAITLDQTVTRLDQRIRDLCSVAAADLLQHAPRAAQEMAAVNGKTATVEIQGQTLRVPRQAVKVLEPAIMHIIRNAVTHGIEEREIRRKAGKPLTGRISIEAKRDNGDFVFTIADDGGGIDFKGLLTKAVWRGILPRGRTLSPADMHNLVFTPGISDRSSNTAALHGPVMATIKNQIKEIGGRIIVNSQAGRGTRFTIRIPHS